MTTPWNQARAKLEKYGRKLVEAIEVINATGAELDAMVPGRANTTVLNQIEVPQVVLDAIGAIPEGPDPDVEAMAIALEREGAEQQTITASDIGVISADELAGPSQ